MADEQSKRAQFEQLNADIRKAAAGDAQISRPVRLLARLRELKDAADENEWLEAVILVRCMVRAKPRRTHGTMAKLRKRYEKAGDDARFHTLQSLVTKILAPDALTPHGYHRTFQSMTNSAIQTEIGASTAPLKALGKPVMLYAGGLLGSVRDGKFIDHDDDIDLAVMLGETPQDQLFDKWLDYKKKLRDLGLLADGQDKSDVCVFRIKSDSFVVELFPSWTFQGHYSVYPYSLAEIPEDQILPLHDMTGSDIMMPKNSEALLAQSYGPNWRTPDPFFHVNWVRQKRRFHFLHKGSYAI